MIKACETNGRLILFKKPMPCEEAWFIAKNKGEEHYAAIWNCMKSYNCKYTPEVNKKIDELAKNMLVDGFRPRINDTN